VAERTLEMEQGFSSSVGSHTPTGLSPLRCGKDGASTAVTEEFCISRFRVCTGRGKTGHDRVAQSTELDLERAGSGKDEDVTGAEFLDVGSQESAMFSRDSTESSSLVSSTLEFRSPGNRRWNAPSKLSNRLQKKHNKPIGSVKLTKGVEAKSGKNKQLQLCETKSRGPIQ